MTKDIITYNGKDYLAEWITHPFDDLMCDEILVADEMLGDILSKDSKEFTDYCSNAMRVDEYVYCYVPHEVMVQGTEAITAYVIENYD